MGVIGPLPELTQEQIAKFYETQDPDGAASVLAEALQLPDYASDARSAIRLDYTTYALQYARDVGFGPLRTAALLGVANNLLYATTSGCSYAEAEATFKSAMLGLTSPKPGADSGQLSPDQVAGVARFFARTFFRHFRLYARVFSSEQELTEGGAALLVETARVQPFDAAQSEEEWQAEAEQARLAAEAAAREEEEARAAAAAAAEREEAERAAAEAEAARRAELERKPATLEEAVAQMVAVRVEAEKAALADEYAAREEVLARRISDLEVGGGGAPKKK
uniref:Uncharacterized protein n=1 Tax=Chlamydomonas leiostraca TaxID=1034604 RepID=A0A7S0R2Q0_9CHLO|mmetsp:Transcript_12405/g.30480  ORF Transcript_12405/g.30480 Transcript_12405/m.30480 type:complete len:280 (+) Transcript_12405:91-930(+)|eukprot:CAMPEP_0202862198 /NCGR_PEP_ID=MMETSP1391-20130828/3328_1 /ASSEMBLY_ACC=CAM_ASM_000867 /TAXON_ID=1034604 /ORGANISM="Chlamydomonas leiostraca, Strain SAG 11-49" /LENGTH=279 /DNA_ID=CAMNT_0049541703 /DNA_START=91 /DNA_END=930 /DNA_ORIENTATION=-